MQREKTQNSPAFRRKRRTFFHFIENSTREAVKSEKCTKVVRATDARMACFFQKTVKKPSRYLVYINERQ